MMRVGLGLSLGVLAPHLASLGSVSSSRGRASLAFQFLCVMGLKWRGLDLGRRIPSYVVPVLTILGLLGDYKWKRGGRNLLWGVLSVGMVPSLSQVESGDVFNGQADVPALVSLLIGLCLNQVRACAVIVLMLTGGEAFEEYALNRAGDSLHSLLAQSPGVAHYSKSFTRTQKVRVDSSFVALDDISAQDVCKNDIILVKQGEIVPVDGIVCSDEECMLDEGLITGEGIPVRKQNGDRVFGGSQNTSLQSFWLRALGPYSESLMALLQGKLSEALLRKSKLEIESKRFVSFFTPLTFAMASIACLLHSKRPARKMWETILSVFMSATPCPAAIGVPIAMLSGMSVASKFGVTIKRGAALEVLSKVTCVVLDKTGTLSYGHPVVSRVVDVRNQLGEYELVRLLASVEQYSTHPLGGAICRYFRETWPGQQHLLPTANLVQEDGNGIRAIVHGGMVVRVGGRAFCGYDDSKTTTGQNKSGDLETFFWIGKQTGECIAEGHIAFVDKLRPSAHTLVKSLLPKYRVLLLSGDRSGNLGVVADELGVNEYYSCFPHEKSEKVRELQKEGHVVLFIGDGGNDAAALACADVGMSIGTSSLASDSATVVLMNGDLANVDRLLGLSRGVVRVARRTVGYGMTASLVQMCGAAGGMLSPLHSAMLQEMVDLGAVLYSLQTLYL
eukprot:CAMPEP_0203761550 /NCGR_PEP_ID=MMETSP0098-20131031/14605_1 /ASSEMBLY_ACC=CAM_ASM_000208 /TAXON_ID=96639 /ORGANISM=" , Strain NY0313808BC1" /LENGTH=673 /DNA_ID=CAMNT_0050655583 /DNA_START=472 /DNA_END=2493 /DNA_ORIENTATION=+